MADPGDGTPTWRQRRLGMELRRLREERNLGPHAAASLLGRTESSLSKLENAQRGIRKPALEQILDKYQVTDEEYRNSLFILARDAKKQGWWHTYEGSLSSRMLDYIAVEAASTKIRSLELHLVPGLLQVDGYAREIISSGISMGKADVDGLAAVRARRQQILTAPDAPQFWPIISEAALRQMMGGPEVMREQMAHLLEASSLSNVILQVLPFSAGAHPGHNGSFTAFDADGLGIVLVESLTTGWYLEEAGDLQRYDLVFGHLRATALSQSDSRRLIEELMSQT